MQRSQFILIRTLLALAPFVGAANAQETQLRKPEVLTTQFTPNSLKAELPEGFHVNLQAPNRVAAPGEEPSKPKAAKERSLSFTLPKLPAAGSEAVLYVCDDANTFCDVHRLPL